MAPVTLANEKGEASAIPEELANKVPRHWQTRWSEHGGQLFGDRMIARKNDPIWAAISAFGNPYPPFDYNSGMGLREIDRRTAESLGVIRPSEKIAPAHKGFNDNLSLSCTNLTPPLIAKLQSQFGDQVVFQDNRAQWQANLIKDFVGHVGKNPGWKGKISLGVATPDTVEAAAKYADLTDYNLMLTADETRHTIKKHGEGNEKDGSQIGLTPEDFGGLADLWRSPDEVGRGNQKKTPDSLIFRKEEGGVLTMVTWTMSRKNKMIYLQTLYKKKGEGGAS